MLSNERKIEIAPQMLNVNDENPWNRLAKEMNIPLPPNTLFDRKWADELCKIDKQFMKIEMGKVGP